MYQNSCRTIQMKKLASLLLTALLIGCTPKYNKGIVTCWSFAGELLFSGEVHEFFISGRNIIIHPKKGSDLTLVNASCVFERDK